MSHCWDCEVETPEGEALCSSCERHREDGHEPAALDLGEAEACHGAGPDGLDYGMLAEAPRPRAGDETHRWPVLT